MKHFNITSRFFKNLFFVSCTIGILPLLLLGYLSYHKSASIVQEEVTVGNHLILQQNKDQVEALLKTVDTLTTQTIGTPVTTSSVSMQTVLDLPYEYEHHKLFQSLIYKLAQIQVFELGISDVHLISFRKDWLVEGGIVYLMEGREIRDAKDRQLRDLRERLISYKEKDKWSYWKLEQRSDNEFILKLIKHIPLNSTEPYGLITVNIPLSEISKRLTGEGQLGTTMIFDEDGTILTHTEPERIGTDVRSEPFYEQLVQRSEANGHFPMTIDNDQYAIIFNESAYNGWTYVSLTPLEQLTVKSDSIKGYTILTIALLILLVVLTAIIVSLRMYSPIRRIYRFMKPDTPPSNGDELQYISEQVQRMIHSQERLAEKIEVLNRQADIFFVFRLLHGEIRQDELVEQLDKYGYPLNWDEWCLMALKIDTLENTRFQEKDYNLLMYAIQNMAEEIVPAHKRLRPVIQKHCLFILIGVAAEDRKPIKVESFHIADILQQKIKSYLNVKISVGVSKSYTDLTDAPIAYQESLEALSYRFRLGQESILFIDEIQPERQDRFQYPKNLEFKMMEAIRAIDPDGAKDALREILDRFFATHANHYDYQVFLGRLFNNLTGMVQDAGTSVQDVFAQNIFQSDIWLGMHSAEQVHDWFERHILDPLLHWMEETKKNREINITEEIINAIHHEYDQDLSIDLFASRLNFHPNYISRVFKKETGVTFTEYLSNYRIEISKRWLRETDMKISEIAKKLRYSTASNFNRNFKKIVKVTPTQYRESFSKRREKTG